tara:strand:- start:2042 stop:2278 length:237 start_codon:yes stop_codon:yes gene_type:complete
MAKQIASYEDLLLEELKSNSKDIKNKIKARNLMIVKLFNSRMSTKMRIQEIAAAADISRKHVYTIVKQVQEGKYEQGS